MRRRERGAILLLAMVFLLLLGLVAGTVLHSSTLAMRMAGNFHFNEMALQGALSVAQEVGDEPSNFDAAVDVGHVRCLMNSMLAGCDTYDVTARSSLASLPESAMLQVRVTRDHPHQLHSLDVREPEARASTARLGRYSIHEVDVTVTGSGRGASARITRGVALREQAGGGLYDTF